MNSRAPLALALIADLVGAGGALLASTQAWQTVITRRVPPFADDALHLSGRTVDSAATAMSLVALAGVIAVLATRGLARRIVGGVLVLAGIGLIWRSLESLRPVSATRALALVQDRHSGVAVDATSAPQVIVHAEWAALSCVAGLLVFLAGGLVALRGHQWLAMSTRYDAPSARPRSAPDEATERTRAAASLWGALDRGDDPTAADRPEN